MRGPCCGRLPQATAHRPNGLRHSGPSSPWARARACGRAPVPSWGPLEPVVVDLRPSDAVTRRDPTREAGPGSLTRSVDDLDLPPVEAQAVDDPQRPEPLLVVPAERARVLEPIELRLRVARYADGGKRLVPAAWRLPVPEHQP